MNDFLAALLLGCLPAAGNIAGGVLAELISASQRQVALALHAAAGVVLAVVAVELMPTALAAATPWIIALAFFAGGGFFVLADHSIGIISQRFGNAPTHTDRGAWLVFFGVAVDLFSDGVMIGAGTTVSFNLALLLALGQVPADLPEGFATVANFKRRGYPRPTRLLLSLGFAVPLFAGTAFGYWLVRGQPEIYKLTLLAFTAGVLTTVVVEEIVPEAHEDGESRLAALVFVSGFALFVLVSAYLG